MAQEYLPAPSNVRLADLYNKRYVRIKKIPVSHHLNKSKC